MMAEEVQGAVPVKPLLRGEILSRLRHRSRCDSENGTDQGAQSQGSATESNMMFQTKPDDGQGSATKNGTESGEKLSSEIPQDAASTSGSKSFRDRYPSVFSLLGFELTRGYFLAADEIHYEERRERVYTFMSTPFQVEKFCMFGFLQCVDTFLFFAVLLPIRIVLAVLRILSYPCVLIMNYSYLLFLSTQGASPRGRRHFRIIQPAHWCDVLKGLLFVASFLLLDILDTSRLYHMVRGQAVIKLYVFYNMLDLADKLLSGAGQDLLDALYWTATEPGHKRRRIPDVIYHFIVALVYITVHTFLILCQAIVLNVAFNSHNKALLTIMISNNFVEIKGSLFKRIDKNNLQQISCSDVKERFHLLVLLFVVFIRNMTEFNWDFDHVGDMVQDTVYIIIAEVVVDWIKHAFITKFNEIPAETYRTYSVNLARDILTSQEKHAHTDYSDQVCRRMGLAPLPLMCLVVQVCSKSFNIADPFAYILVFLFCLCLMSTKLLTSITLLSWGCRLLEGAEEDGYQAKPCDIDSQVLAKKESKKDAVNASPQKTSPLKNGQDYSTNNGQSTPVRRTGTGIQGGGIVDWDVDTINTAWVLHSASDSVVERQSQVLDRSFTPVRQSVSAELFTSTSDNWVEESSGSESDKEYFNSEDQQTIPQPPFDTVLGSTSSAVDYDEEKKFK